MKFFSHETKKIWLSSLLKRTDTLPLLHMAELSTGKQRGSWRYIARLIVNLTAASVVHIPCRMIFILFTQNALLYELQHDANVLELIGYNDNTTWQKIKVNPYAFPLFCSTSDRVSRFRSSRTRDLQRLHYSTLPTFKHKILTPDMFLSRDVMILAPVFDGSDSQPLKSRKIFRNDSADALTMWGNGWIAPRRLASVALRP